MLKSVKIALLALMFSASACGNADEDALGDGSEEELLCDDIDPAFFSEPEGKADQSWRTFNDLVRSGSCSSGSLSELSIQIGNELICGDGGDFASIMEMEHIELQYGALPFLHVRAAEALAQAEAQVGRRIRISSAWRSVAQQYLLNLWRGRCGIGVVAKPGRSAHESGLAIDTPDAHDRTIRNALKAAGFRWYCDVTNRGRWSGCRDPVHFHLPLTSQTSSDRMRASVLAFQRLWNRNQTEDRNRLTEDGEWGWGTQTKLKSSPLSGFGQSVGCAAALDRIPDDYWPFVGDGCQNGEDCGFDYHGHQGYCHTAGFCTISCDGYCPDRYNRASTFCTADPGVAPTQGICVSHASHDNGHCADLPGSVDASANRYVGSSGARSRMAEVCLPAP